MQEAINEDVLKAFNLHQYTLAEPISSGLINATYKVEKEGKGFLLQKINTSIFNRPEAIQGNYKKIRDHLIQNNSFQLPCIIHTQQGSLLYNSDGDAWRCFEFIPNTYSPATAATADQAYTVAHSFGQFSANLSGLSSTELSVILPRFHDVAYRFDQFEEAIKNNADRSEEVADLIKLAYSKKYLLLYFETLLEFPDYYPQRIMHHDCKISNILFDSSTNNVVCPIDLDTTQPGFFFSDIGDMIRSMVPSVSENEPDVDKVEVRMDFYKAIIAGYEEAMHQSLTAFEQKSLGKAALLVIYMQALRFLTDYLAGNVYYKVDYEEQNKHRTRNQLQLLSLLEQIT